MNCRKPISKNGRRFATVSPNSKRSCSWATTGACSRTRLLHLHGGGERADGVEFYRESPPLSLQGRTEAIDKAAPWGAPLSERSRRIRCSHAGFPETRLRIAAQGAARFVRR